MSGGSMLRTRRKDVNVKPNRRLDRKSSRGMLYENEELRLRTININAEVERGQSDIKKLRRENEQLRREVGALRGEYDRLERLLKDRHQQDYSDPEESGSCCSDCESECCNVQNSANAANDIKVKINENCTEDKECSIITDGKLSKDRGRLTSVPEEPRSPQPQTNEAFPMYSYPPQITACPLEDPTLKEYYTAMVTLPMAAHIPEPNSISMEAATVFPKSGLDILVNNDSNIDNVNEFEDFPLPPPPIGFVFPDKNLPLNNDELILVPNVEFVETNIEKNNEEVLNSPKTENQFVKSFESLPQISTNASSENLVKDSYFVCKTKKIIQQCTKLQNPQTNGTEKLVCNCGCTPNQATEVSNIIDDSNNPLYKTEKNIELTYDYPKPIAHYPVSTTENNLENMADLTQTTHTTTEVNSTVVMIERTKVPEKGVFKRSQSAPCTISTEPVYATVHKLPKKLKKLHIKNLENEKLDSNKITERVEKTEEKLNNEESVNNDEESEVSEKLDISCKSNVIPKSSGVRKKKRFSIHFKRKSNKNTEKEIKQQVPVTQTMDKETEPTSPDTPDTPKLINPEPLIKLDSILKHNGNLAVESSNEDHHHHHHRHHHQHGSCSGHRKQHRSHDCKHGYSTFRRDSFQEMTTSHSERERTNSLSSSVHSRFSIPNHKASPATKEGSIPWCGCWGNGCL